MGSTNISGVLNSVLIKAFNKTKEDNFLSDPRYGDETYTHVSALLEDNPDIETVEVTLKNITFAPVVNNVLQNDEVIGQIIVDVAPTEELTTEQYHAVRTLVESYEQNPIRIIRNLIELDQAYEVPININVKYTQEFIIKAGDYVSNTFEIINQNLIYNKHFYVNLDDDVVAKIGTQSAYNALQMKNYKATYTGSNEIEIDKWFIGISTPQDFDIRGYTTTYSQLTLPKNIKSIIVPTLRIKDILEYHRSFEIESINTGKFNVLEIKSEPIFSGSKLYDRVVIYSNNINYANEDIIFKIQNLKNFYIPKGEVQTHYQYSLVNALPSVVTSSPVTSIGRYNPYDYESMLISLDTYFQDVSPDTPITETEVIDPNAITNPLNIHVNTNNNKVFITKNPKTIDYKISIAEFNSVVNIYEDTTLLGQGMINEDGNFETKLMEPLSDGPHTLYFTIEDDWGNVSEPSPTITINIDTERSTPPIISSYFVDDDFNSNVNWETYNHFDSYQMYGVTNNQNPVIMGFVKEQSTINLYLNGELYASAIPTYENGIIHDYRIGDDTFGFIYRVSGLITGTNSIAYEIVDQAGNTSIRSQAAFIIYEPINDSTPKVYTIDNRGFKIEMTSSSIIMETEDNELTFVGTGAKNKTYTNIYKVVNGTEIFLGRALVKNNEFSWKYTFSFNNYLLRFKVKNTSGVEIIIDKDITIVSNKPTVDIQVENVPIGFNELNEDRYKLVTFTFNEEIYDFSFSDLEANKCHFVEETKFGIEPLQQTTPNKVFQAIIKLNENYNIDTANGFIKLRSDSVYNINGIYNQEGLYVGIENGMIPIIPDIFIDTRAPTTPTVSLTVRDNRFGTRLLKDGDSTDDNTPTFLGTNIGAWVEDTILPIPLTRSFKLPKNANYYTEVINSSPFDKYRAKILEIQTVATDDYKTSFSYLSKDSKFYDYMFFKDKDSIIIPEYDANGNLYYKTLTITYNQFTHSYVVTPRTILANNYNPHPNLRDYLANNFLDKDDNGEYDILSTIDQDPIVKYQICTNDYSAHTREATVRIERYLVIFTSQNTVQYKLFIDNPLGTGAIDIMHLDDEFHLDYQPDDAVVSKAMNPNYESFEVITPLNSQYIKYTKVKSTDTTPQYYKFELVDSVGNSSIAVEPVVIKLNLFYIDTLESGKNKGTSFKLPIKPYQMVDNSEIMEFSWFNPIKIYTDLKLIEPVDPINPKRISYLIGKSNPAGSYIVKFFTIKRIKFLAFDPTDPEAINLNSYDFNFSNNSTLLTYEIIDSNGVPFNENFELILKNSTFTIVPKNPNVNFYKLLDKSWITIKFTFESNLNSTEIEIESDYLESETFQELNYFKIISIEKLFDTETMGTNFIKHEYVADKYFDSVRQNLIDTSSNKHTSYNAIEDFMSFETYADKSNLEVTPIYPTMNDFNFNSEATFVIKNLVPNENPDNSAILIPPEINLKKEQVIVRDLAYYGLEKACTIYKAGDTYRVKADASIYLNNKNFLEETYPAFDDDPFDIYETNSEETNNLNNRPPAYIWVHMIDLESKEPSEVNNLSHSEWLGTVDNFHFTKPIGKYVEWIWDDIAESDFWIEGNQLDTLTTGINGNVRSLPKIIRGNFRCNDNNLVNLIGGPEEVGGTYIAKNNKLTSLKGLAKIIGGLSRIYWNNTLDAWAGSSTTSWTQTNNVFSDDEDFNIWNDNFMENAKVGSSLDLSFNPLNINAFNPVDLPTNILLGWNLYLAGTNIQYSTANITTIRARIHLAGLIFFYFDTTKYTYLIKDPVITEVSILNSTNLDDTEFVNTQNHFTRLLNISDTDSTDYRSVFGTNVTVTDLITKLKFTNTFMTSAMKLYQSTNHEII